MTNCCELYLDFTDVDCAGVLQSYLTKNSVLLANIDCDFNLQHVLKKVCDINDRIMYLMC